MAESNTEEWIGLYYFEWKRKVPHVFDNCFSANVIMSSVVSTFQQAFSALPACTRRGPRGPRTCRHGDLIPFIWSVHTHSSPLNWFVTDEEVSHLSAQFRFNWFRQFFFQLQSHNTFSFPLSRIYKLTRWEHLSLCCSPRLALVQTGRITSVIKVRNSVTSDTVYVCVCVCVCFCWCGSDWLATKSQNYPPLRSPFISSDPVLFFIHLSILFPLAFVSSGKNDFN